jgi:hypothetical protein
MISHEQPQPNPCQSEETLFGRKCDACLQGVIKPAIVSELHVGSESEREAIADVLGPQVVALLEVTIEPSQDTCSEYRNTAENEAGRAARGFMYNRDGSPPSDNT